MERNNHGFQLFFLLQMRPFLQNQCLTLLRSLLTLYTAKSIFFKLECISVLSVYNKRVDVWHAFLTFILPTHTVEIPIVLKKADISLITVVHIHIFGMYHSASMSLAVCHQTVHGNEIHQTSNEKVVLSWWLFRILMQLWHCHWTG